MSYRVALKRNSVGLIETFFLLSPTPPDFFFLSAKSGRLASEAALLHSVRIRRACPRDMLQKNPQSLDV